MIKKSTGVKFNPIEFRQLQTCVSCLKKTKIEVGEKCEVCAVIDFKFCENCECVMREGSHKFYGYDNTDNHRESDFNFLASKEFVREFIFEEELPPLRDEKICNGCIGWEKRMKDICFWCDNDFTNSRENYKLNGNSCELCSKTHGLNI